MVLVKAGAARESTKIYIMNIQSIDAWLRRCLASSILGSWPSDEHLEHTMTSASPNCRSKKRLLKIELADLENVTETACNVTKMSVNVVVAISCLVTPYYSLSLSKYKLYESHLGTEWKSGLGVRVNSNSRCRT